MLPEAVFVLACDYKLEPCDGLTKDYKLTVNDNCEIVFSQHGLDWLEGEIKRMRELRAAQK